MTSANVTYFDIYQSGEFIKRHSQHHYCKSNRQQLLDYTPPEDYQIMVVWPDENEVDHCSPMMLLSDYLNGMKYELDGFEEGWDDQRDDDE